MNKTITSEHTKIILTEMLKRVGVNYDIFDFSKDNWFMSHSWTEEEQDDFIKWLAQFLRDKKYVKYKKYRGKDAAIHEASKIAAFYGWKIKRKNQDE